MDSRALGVSQNYAKGPERAETQAEKAPRLVWKDLQALAAVDSHPPAQGALQPLTCLGNPETTEMACSAAVSLMKFQVQSLSFIWPAYWHRAEEVCSISK